MNEIGYPNLSLRGFTGVVCVGEVSGFSLVIYECGGEPPIDHYRATGCRLAVVLLIAQTEVFDS
ncbi:MULTISPECIES: hypothetical protein [unclassified Rhodococcus (in: high G+C Gram-positive bacteria)]|uniref:hypothetical protein n=1 Tax=unclassified Rhodococcus (in: high G+C Gram-positive bacteria) TaxID=192944 RepID=UPI001179C41A|nr:MULTISPECIES: hypothetical protein [unclassified Rhodococcus (in: high G+C Gram-positive bacteria)]